MKEAIVKLFDQIFMLRLLIGFNDDKHDLSFPWYGYFLFLGSSQLITCMSTSTHPTMGMVKAICLAKTVSQKK